MSDGWLSAEAFEAIVVDELDLLPDEMVDGLENVAFVVEDAPDDGEDLLGRYEGVDLTHRDRYGFGELPDRIVVFRLPHLAACATRARDRALLRARRRPPARVGLGVAPGRRAPRRR